MLNYFSMGFKENLKDELKYQGMLVKELADKSGIPKGTIDHYLAEKNTEPIAENAVKIANALNVSVEYLVTGKETGFTNIETVNSYKMRLLISKLSKFNDKQLHFVQEMIEIIEKNLK